MKGAIVYLSEEYGYRLWVWKTGMTEDELIDWWKVQTNLNDTMIRSLPGRVEKSTNGKTPSEYRYYAHLHNNDDSYLKIYPDKIIHHAGYVSEDEWDK